MSDTSAIDTPFPLEIESAAASRGPLAMQAVGLHKDFRLGRGKVLSAVRDVSFGLYKGAVVALVGESGSGKSTVAKLLAGQERPTSGSIRLDDAPVEHDRARGGELLPGQQPGHRRLARAALADQRDHGPAVQAQADVAHRGQRERSEERRVGKEWLE